MFVLSGRTPKESSSVYNNLAVEIITDYIHNAPGPVTEEEVKKYCINNTEFNLTNKSNKYKIISHYRYFWKKLCEQNVIILD